jgi:hypothetical protein
MALGFFAMAHGEKAPGSKWQSPIYLASFATMIVGARIPVLLGISKGTDRCSREHYRRFCSCSAGSDRRRDAQASCAGCEVMEQTNTPLAHRPWFQWLSAVVLAVVGICYCVQRNRIEGAVAQLFHTLLPTLLGFGRPLLHQQRHTSTGWGRSWQRSAPILTQTSHGPGF